MSAQPVVEATSRTAAAAPVPTVLDVVRAVRHDVQRTRFPLAVDGADAARALRAGTLDSLREHLLPRLEQVSTPAVVVAAGSTGAGKSTLVNSLLGAEVSPAGVLRPTTRRPVLAHHPADADLLARHPLLEVVDVVAHERVPRGLALLDAPDLDSVLAANRETAHRLLAGADLWLFVTTAARYGDALPWEVLEGALSRRASVAMVLNRVPDDAVATVRGDLLARLRERGMAGVPLFVVPDAGPHEGLLDADAVEPVRRWLATVAGADHARAVVARTLGGALGSLAGWVGALADAVDHQAAAAAALRAEVAAALTGPLSSVAAAVETGVVADVAVRDAWDDVATGSGPLARAVGRRGRLRGSRRAGRRREAALLDVAERLRAAVTDHLVAVATDAEAALVDRLRDRGAPDGGAGLVADRPSAGHATARRQDAARAAAGWVAAADPAVHALASAPGRDGARRASDALDALGAQGLATVALASAAGVDAAGRLLDVALGPDAPALVDALRADLVARVRAAVEREAESLTEHLAVPDLAPGAADRLRRHVPALEGLT